MLAQRDRTRLRTAYTTAAGRLYIGDSAELLAAPALRRRQGEVQLVFTSPPFPLCREKRYGNLRGEAYTEWLASFARPLADLLTPTGSIVIELGNGWVPGTPTVSTAGIKSLLAFQEAAGLYLCQEFICYNPARLPTPAEWVTVRRVRVKDSFTRVWWMSPTPHPKADNRRVLTAYSESMKRLLARGTYNGGNRPSGHQIGHESFLSNNGGAIPPNVLVPPAARVEEPPEAVLSISNTGSNGRYQRGCRSRAAAQSAFPGPSGNRLPRPGRSCGSARRRIGRSASGRRLRWSCTSRCRRGPSAVRPPGNRPGRFGGRRREPGRESPRSTCA